MSNNDENDNIINRIMSIKAGGDRLGSATVKSLLSILGYCLAGWLVGFLGAVTGGDRCLQECFLK